MQRDEVFEVIHDERLYQDRKWGPAEHERAAWAAFINHYARRLLDHAIDEDNEAFDNDLRKLAALAVAAGEDNGMEERK